MSEEQQSAIQQATDLVNAGNFSEALEKSRAILVTDPTNADAKLIEAISLSQLKNTRDASEAFAEAVRLAPGDARIRFNAAVHENNAGNADQARILAQEVLNADPNHQGAKDLLAQISQTTTAVPPGAYPREGAAGFEPPHEGIGVVRSMGSAWLGIGIFLALASLCLMAWTLISVVPHISEIMKAGQSQDQARMNELMAGLRNPVLTAFSWVVLGGNLIWTIMDIIHRRGNFLWLLPHIPCTCCGFGFLTQGLYILFGRK